MTNPSSGNAIGVGTASGISLGGLAAPNPFQPSASNVGQINPPGSTNHGICSLTHQGKRYRFRTNPNEIWWTYELITFVDETYGGRVVQLLGTRLGDLTVKVECGLGGWDYLMQTCLYLRDVIDDQRGGNPAMWEYTTRNWKLGVYAMNIPFQDEVEAVNRELTLNFKIQEDVTDVISQATLATEFARIQDGVYRPDQNVHNQYNDFHAGGKPLDMGTVNPTGYQTIGQPNKVDQTPQGDNPGGINPFGSIPFLSNIPGIGNILGGL